MSESWEFRGLGTGSITLREWSDGSLGVGTENAAAYGLTVSIDLATARELASELLQWAGSVEEWQVGTMVINGHSVQVQVLVRDGVPTGDVRPVEAD